MSSSSKNETTTPLKITFEVDNVNPGKYNQKELFSSEEIVRCFCNYQQHVKEVLEASGVDEKDSQKWIYSEGHGFFGAALFAFKDHFPLCISPDHIFQVILEGWSRHVERNAEKLRKNFVSHEGKKTLKVQNDSFVKGNKNNPWPEVFDAFCQQIAENTESNLYAVVNEGKFSTSDAVAMIARNVSLMSLTKHYFEFRFHTDCGFPSITLMGKLEDWVLLKQKVNSMRTFMVSEFADKWIPALQSILDKFVDAYNGKVDKFFWGSMVKYESTHGSGADTYISGWINTLFPYFEGGENAFCLSWEQLQEKIKKAGGAKRLVYGPSVGSFGRFFCTAPVIWRYLGTEYTMMFKTGFVGATQKEDGTVTPQLSWAVVEEKKEEIPKNCSCEECFMKRYR